VTSLGRSSSLFAVVYKENPMICKECKKLKKAIKEFVSGMNRLFKEPPSFDRGGKIAELIGKLEDMV
jgi:hypothetical protein